MPKRKMTLDPELATEAKIIVVLAFRNGPIEDIHAGKDCPTCSRKSEYSHITQTEMKKIMNCFAGVVHTAGAKEVPPAAKTGVFSTPKS
jgi:hypothetical protein